MSLPPGALALLGASLWLMSLPVIAFLAQANFRDDARANVMAGLLVAFAVGLVVGGAVCVGSAIRCRQRASAGDG